MANKLSKLFDYQKYEPNGKLQSIIDDVESRYAGKMPKELSDDELTMVAAAGNPELDALKKKDPKNRKN